MLKQTADKLRELKAKDAARPGVPGEHWMVLGAGLAAMKIAGRARSPVMRLLGSMVGTALVGRAASGRDGVARLAKYIPAARVFR